MYGVNCDDMESSKIQASGFVVREANEIPSNYRSDQSLDSFLKDNKIVGIQEVDTRMITRIIRDEGSMNAIISSNNLMIMYLGIELQSLALYVLAAVERNSLKSSEIKSCSPPGNKTL